MGREGVTGVDVRSEGQYAKQKQRNKEKVERGRGGRIRQMYSRKNGEGVMA